MEFESLVVQLQRLFGEALQVQHRAQVERDRG